MPTYDPMDDSETKAESRKLVTTLISTLSRASGVDVDAIVGSLKTYEVKL